MTDSCRERIVSAVLGILTGVADQLKQSDFTSQAVTVERNRRDPISDTECPWIGLFEREETRTNDFSSEDGYSLPLMVQGAIAGKGEDASKAANALRASIMAALLSDRSVQGLARDLMLDSLGDWMGVGIDSGDIEGFELAFTVLYATKENDPFTFEWE